MAFSGAGHGVQPPPQVMGSLFKTHADPHMCWSARQTMGSGPGPGPGPGPGSGPAIPPLLQEASASTEAKPMFQTILLTEYLSLSAHRDSPDEPTASARWHAITLRSRIIVDFTRAQRRTAAGGRPTTTATARAAGIEQTQQRPVTASADHCSCPSLSACRRGRANLPVLPTEAAPSSVSSKRPNRPA